MHALLSSASVLLSAAGAIAAPLMLPSIELTASHPAVGRATPMDALAEAIFTFAPDAGPSATPTIDRLRAKPSPVRWKTVSSGKSGGPTDVGSLAGGTVKIPNSSSVWQLTVEWFAPEGQPFGFDPVKAFRAKGFRVQALYCAPMVSEGTNYFLISAPGKRAGFLSVYAFDAPTATSVADWSISYRLDGYIPSLAEIQNGDDKLATTDCSSQPFGNVGQISRADAMAIAKRSMSALNPDGR